MIWPWRREAKCETDAEEGSAGDSHNNQTQDSTGGLQKVVTSNWVFSLEGQQDTPEPVESAAQPSSDTGIFRRFLRGLSASSSRITQGISQVFTGRVVDDALLNDFEDALLQADVGIKVVTRLRQALEQKYKGQSPDLAQVQELLIQQITQIMQPALQKLVIPQSSQDGPFVILFVGVNGSGKTTSIGKLALQLRQAGKTVSIVAGDTFRAAAVEQLQQWAQRVEADFVSGHDGCDAAGLVYDAFAQAKEKQTDILLVDTAGRLQNRRDLMDELNKIRRVLGKHGENLPQETILVLDATVGQNAFSQLENFHYIVPITGLVMTKLDGTAKGGVLVGLVDGHRLPIYAVGMGEKATDLYPFDVSVFARSLVGIENNKAEEEAI